MKTRMLVLTTAITAMLVAGCSEQADAPPGTTETSVDAIAALPTDLFAAKAPADAISILDLKAGNHQGEAVTVTGRIGGREEPFVDGRAMFTLTDLSLPDCTEVEDHCPTPWDSCCELPEDISANMISVRITGEDGKMLEESIKGAGGLDPMATLTITGTVSEQNEDFVVLDAETIHVHGA